jgi:hypothetical protein
MNEGENLDLEGQELDQAAQEPELILGKFKTQDDLVHSYSELEKNSTKKNQQLGRVVEQLRSSGYDVDDDGNIIPPQQQPTQQQQGNPPSGDWTEQFNEQFYENPAQAMMQMMSQANQASKMAQANTRRAMAQYRNDPVYAKIADEFEAEMMGVPDNQLVNPQNAAYIAEQLFNSVAGRYLRREASRVRENPADRQAFMQNLGVEGPAPAQQSRPSEDIGYKGRAMLEGFFGNDRQAKTQVLQAYDKRLDGE